MAASPDPAPRRRTRGILAMADAATEYRCNRLTWAEMNDAISARKVDLVARKTVLETESLCFACSYFAFLTEAFATVRRADRFAIRGILGAR